MSQNAIQGSCTSCNSRFAIPFSELKDDMSCPVCGNYADVTVICPHCGQEIFTNGRTLGCCIPCPDCNNDFVWNTVISTDGTPMVVSMTGRLEMHDMGSLLNIMQQQLGKSKNEPRSNMNISDPQSAAKHRTAEPKGCLGSIAVIMSFCASVMAIIFILLKS